VVSLSVLLVTDVTQHLLRVRAVTLLLAICYAPP
jgi:hypothetical protein